MTAGDAGRDRSRGRHGMRAKEPDSVGENLRHHGPGDRRGVVELGASAIGLNFYAPSPRSVTAEAAREICREVGSEIDVVGLFVNHSLEAVSEIVTFCGLTTVQLHGNEPPEYVARLAETAPLDIIRVYRVGASGLDEARSDLQQCRQLGISLRACLVDARVEGAFGGTGECAPWNLLRDEWLQDEWPHSFWRAGCTPKTSPRPSARSAPGASMSPAASSRPRASRASSMSGGSSRTRAAVLEGAETAA